MARTITKCWRRDGHHREARVDYLQLDRSGWVIKRPWIESYRPQPALVAGSEDLADGPAVHDILHDRGVYYKLAARDMSTEHR